MFKRRDWNYLYGDGLRPKGEENKSSSSDDDSDSDGLTNAFEFALGTDPGSSDSDGDGLKDGVETRTGFFVSASNTGSDPTLPDSDADGLSDGEEVNTHNTSPVAADTDGDGLTDPVEISEHGTAPDKADTDGDGNNDSSELLIGTDPLAFKELDHARKKVPFLYKVPKQYTFCGLSLDDSFTQCRKMRVLAVYRRTDGAIVTLNVRDIKDAITLHTRFGHAAHKGGNTGPPKPNRARDGRNDSSQVHDAGPVCRSAAPGARARPRAVVAGRGPARGVALVETADGEEGGAAHLVGDEELQRVAQHGGEVEPLPEERDRLVRQHEAAEERQHAALELAAADQHHLDVLAGGGLGEVVR